MTIARQIADLIDASGDVKSDHLDNVPDSDWNTLLNKPAHADTDTRNAANIGSGILAPARLGSGSPGSGNYLRGDGTWQTNCTNFSNCNSSGGTGTITNGTGTGTVHPNTSSRNCGQNTAIQLTTAGTTITMSNVVCAPQCACACACACNC